MSAGSFFIWAFKLELSSGCDLLPVQLRPPESEVRMMPRGSNPNSRKNLIPFTERSKEEVRELNRKGGKKSGDVRGAFKSLNEDLREQLTPELINQINQRIISLAKSGNLKAYELIRNGIGEDPTKKVELTGNNGGPLEFVWAGDE